MRRKLSFGLILLAIVFSNVTQAQKVGLLFDQFASTRWPIDAKELEDEFAKFGVETSLKIAHSDIAKHDQQGQEFIDEGVDAIVIVTVDGSVKYDFIKNAKEKGILIVAYDRLIIDEMLDLYVTYDPLEVGRIQAQMTVDHIKKGNVLMLNGPISDHNAVEFRKGQLEVLTPLVEAGKINIVDDIVLDSWSDAIALMAMYERTPDFSQIQGIISALDAFNEAIIEYNDYDDEFLKNIYLTGQDPDPKLIDRLNRDIQNMSILKPLQPLAQKTVELTMSKLKNEKNKDIQKIEIDGLKLEGYLFQPIVLDKNNIATYKELLYK